MTIPASIVMLALLAACSALPTDPPDTIEPVPIGRPELPAGFELVDPGRAVTAVAPTRARGSSTEVRVEDAGNGFDYFVSWVGGSCDTETVLAVSRSGATAEITLRVARDDQRFCSDVAELHTLRLTFAAPIHPEGITAVQEPDSRVDPGDPPSAE